MIRIPLSSPDITEAEIGAVAAVMRTNTLSLGPKLEEFESLLATSHQMLHAIAVSSGTAALHLAIRALNISEGHEVIIPSFTFIAVANAVTYERATPVFVDIDPHTLNMNPECVEAAITQRTRALIIVHTFGVPADMDELMSIARKHKLVVIEDACEALGATYKGKRVGTFGDISTFAFYPNKQITTGEGGALLCRDGQIADRVRALRNQGRYPSDDWLQHSEIGYNYRLSEIACALGVVQLHRLESILKRRTEVATRYDELLASTPSIKRPSLQLPQMSISWFVYVVRLLPRYTSQQRDRVISMLQEKGIASGRYFAPIHRQPAYANHLSALQAHLPMTDAIAERTIALPFFNQLSLPQATEVVEGLKDTVAQLD